MVGLIGENLYFIGDEPERIAKVAESLLKIAERMADIVEARKCMVSDMNVLEIALSAQRTLFMSIYRNEKAAEDEDEEMDFSGGLMVKVGNNLSLQAEDADKMMSVVKGLLKLAERMYDVADAHKCSLKEMLDLEIGLIDQHRAFMSIYPDDNPDDVAL